MDYSKSTECLDHKATWSLEEANRYFPIEDHSITNLYNSNQVGRDPMERTQFLIQFLDDELSGKIKTRINNRYSFSDIISKFASGNSNQGLNMLERLAALKIQNSR